MATYRPLHSLRLHLSHCRANCGRSMISPSPPPQAAADHFGAEAGHRVSLLSQRVPIKRKQVLKKLDAIALGQLNDQWGRGVRNQQREGRKL